MTQMTRQNITVEKLIRAGYTPFEFNDYSMEKGIADIKRGCEVILEPRFGGYMVAVVVVNGFPKEMCTRLMTASEKVRFAEEMAEQKKQYEQVSARVHARNKARMRRR